MKIIPGVNFLHTHEITQSKLGLDTDHVIVDREEYQLVLDFLQTKIGINSLLEFAENKKIEKYLPVVKEKYFQYISELTRFLNKHINHIKVLSIFNVDRFTSGGEGYYLMFETDAKYSKTM